MNPAPAQSYTLKFPSSVGSPREIVDRRQLHLAKAPFPLGLFGDRTLNDPSGISRIVNSINEAQWFAVNHGGWADEVPLVLHFLSGEQRTYQVAFYLRQEGAVLISMSNFDRTGKGSGWSNGVAFSPRLPSALAASGVYLPREREWSSRKNKTTNRKKPRLKSGVRELFPSLFLAFLPYAPLRFSIDDRPTERASPNCKRCIRECFPCRWPCAMFSGALG